MALNWIWIGFFLVAFTTAAARWLLGDDAIFQALLKALFDSARTGFEISLGLAGIMALWLGLMRVGERAGMIELLARAAGPLLRRLFPGVPQGHPAQGAMTMNISANLLGLDNAATPLGLKAMQELQSLNTEPAGTASQAQIMFVVMNTAGLTLIPTSVIAIRQSMAVKQGLGADFNAADIFLPTLLVTFTALLAGVLAVAVAQRLPLWRARFLVPVLAVGGLLAAAVAALARLPAEQASRIAGTTGAVAILGIVMLFLLAAAWRRINAYDAFIEGAKEGFGVAIQIVPYLIAILIAIGLFRAAGCMDYLLAVIGAGVTALGLDTDFLPALPVGLMKVLSGAGARGLMIDVMQVHGVDSFAGRLAAIVQGSTETTFYVLAVYFGSVGVKHTRHALACALFADVVGLFAAIGVGYAMLR
ncbi:spore maturation protein SpmA/spore maturation protein SpmB [Hydrogenophaga palleronii]|uniref:Spore maturation protein SpmA/spore maturation protein SpmB n=1 Tax=Hydrogenophaga palleronii TaxID=65655 RepID=A0ABU1WLW8_9BURK|nr:nucleoside recognition domain-containing protein [Hydrogenophaga palleronii]MDR7150297.1 spore maturation protein SpmA/spore maturation protein SpmB [Hydrogenophaga palleronii]